MPGRESLPPEPQRSDLAPVVGLRGLATAALALPAVPAVAADRSPTSLVLAAVAVGLGAAAAWWISRRLGAPRLLLAVLGGLLVVVAGWLLPQADVSPITALIGLGVGVGAGLGGGAPGILRRREAAVGAATGLAILAVLVAVDGVHGTAWAGLLDGVAIAGVGVLAHSRPRTGAQVSVRAAATLAAVVTVGVTCWVGANSPTVTWFGSQVSHGPRDGREVAITFDDGPDDPYTLEIARILDARGAKGTFFMVGKALDRRPDIARALRADGHLLGNHSYHHDEWRWLDPRYPELARTQQAIHRVAGVCPTYYRPPHGQHTPFMADVLHAHHMKMVTWDDSTSDWTTQDANRVARRVLAKVKPGSIIDLHDGLDGKVNVDRTVVVRALPLILEGLRARGLHPVRLDVLLGDQPYSGHCS